MPINMHSLQQLGLAFGTDKNAAQWLADHADLWQ